MSSQELSAYKSGAAGIWSPKNLELQDFQSATQNHRNHVKMYNNIFSTNQLEKKNAELNVDNLIKTWKASVFRNM